MERKLVKLNSLEEAKKELNIVLKSDKVEVSKWSLYKILVHCTQTIEYSMKGYPKLKPLPIRLTIGKLAISKFLKQGYMQHSLNAPVLGAPSIPEEGNVDEAMKNLLEVIDQFLNFKAELLPHLLFGKITKSDYNKYFAMHIADHLSELKY